MSRNGRDLTRRFPELVTALAALTRGKDVRKRPLRIRRHVLEDEVDGHRLITRLVELQLRAPQEQRAQRRWPSDVSGSAPPCSSPPPRCARAKPRSSE
jgi:ATP-dependent DNA ligase